MKRPLHIGWVIILSLLALSANSMAEQIKFSDWVGIEESDAATNANRKRIGTTAADGSSSLWLAVSKPEVERIELTLESDKRIVSDYFSYRIDRVDNLTLRSAQKGCNGHCLTDEVEKNGVLIRTLRRGLRMKFEFDTAPDRTRQPTFSLRGFSRAYQWLLAD